MRRARRGEWCLYWTGNLAYDRENICAMLKPREGMEYMDRADQTASMAYRGYRAGALCLVQRRNSPHSWGYYAVRR